MPEVILSHAGKQHAYHVARALQDLACLQGFYTSSYIRSQWLQDWLSKGGSTFWSRRYLTGLSGQKIHPNWRFEIRELIYARLFGRSGRVNRAVMERDRNFDRYMAKLLHNFQADIFWGFQGSCFESLQSAKQRGMKTVVELAIAHYPSAKAILEEEKKLLPEWSDSIVYADFPNWYLDRLVGEPEVADYVVGASPFTLKTLRDAGIRDEKLILLPLGFEADRIPFDLDGFEPYTGRPLRLLYAGRISQMKGIKYLLEAMKDLSSSDVELHLIGFVQGSEEALKAYKTSFTHHPHVSQKELFAEYKHYDALVLPSVYEGFGLVIVEAMAAGLPVITTDHTMGPEIIEDDKNGYMVPIRDSEAIRVAVEKLLGKSNDELMEMRTAARRAAMDYSWDRYQERLKGVIDQLLTN